MPRTPVASATSYSTRTEVAATNVRRPPVNQSLTIPIMTALDRLWARIRAQHPEVPNAVLTIGAGSNMKGTGTFRRNGHFAAGRWQHNKALLAEVFISGEGLRRPAPEILGTLLHEAAHGLAEARDIKDTSRQGRYHNTRFKLLAEELGLTVTDVPVLGWSRTLPTDATTKRYARQLRTLTTALVVWRHPETDTAPRQPSNNGVVLICDCERRIRVATSTHEQGAITCGLCEATFQPAD